MQNAIEWKNEGECFCVCICESEGTREGGIKRRSGTLTGSLRDVFGGIPGVWPFALWLQIGYDEKNT